MKLFPKYFLSLGKYFKSFSRTHTTVHSKLCVARFFRKGKNDQFCQTSCIKGHKTQYFDEFWIKIREKNFVTKVCRKPNKFGRHCQYLMTRLC